MNPKENINFIFQFNNKARSTNYFLLFIISGVLFLGAAFFFVATNRNYELIAIILAAVVYFILLGMKRPSYFELLVSETHLFINFYAVSVIARNYQSIEIALPLFVDYKIDTRKLKLRKEIIVSQRTKYGIADYPPVSISIVNPKELEQIKYILNKIIEHNRQEIDI